MKVYQKGMRKVWYDPHQRLWTLQVVDENDWQVGDCEYTPFKTEAMEWMNGEA